MNTNEQNKIREEFKKQELIHWSSKASAFVHIPDSSKDLIANWWLEKVSAAYTAGKEEQRAECDLHNPEEQQKVIYKRGRESMLQEVIEIIENLEKRVSSRSFNQQLEDTSLAYNDALSDLLTKLQGK